MSELMDVPNWVSIIIPTFNEPPSIIARLHGLAQLRGVVEVIVVDSSDSAFCRKAIDALSQEQGLSVIHSQIKGRAVQMNLGAEQASGSVLLFLHADTQLPPNSIETVISAQEAGYYWGRFNVQLDDQRLQFRMIEWLMNKRSALTHVATGDQAIFMTREAFDIVWGYDKIELMEDVAMSKKLKRFGPICPVPLTVTTSARRWRQNGITNTIVKMWWLRFRYFVGTPPSELAKSYQHGDWAKQAPKQTCGQAVPIFVFAKAPVPGKVKSRLCPPLDSDQAAQVAEKLLQTVCAELAQSWPDQVYLAVTPDDVHSCFQDILHQTGFKSIQQVGDDLGERVLGAIEHGLQTASMAAVIGADIPQISAAVLQPAYERMANGESVVGPTPDGGFYFLGLSKVSKGLFHNIKWGTNSVFDELMKNAELLQIKLHQLPVLADCDYWEDVQLAATQSAEFKASLLSAGIAIHLLDGK